MSGHSIIVWCAYALHGDEVSHQVSGRHVRHGKARCVLVMADLGGERLTWIVIAGLQDSDVNMQVRQVICSRWLARANGNRKVRRTTAQRGPSNMQGLGFVRSSTRPQWQASVANNGRQKNVDMVRIMIGLLAVVPCSADNLFLVHKFGRRP